MKSFGTVWFDCPSIAEPRRRRAGQGRRVSAHRAYVLAVVCCLAGVLFMRGAASPQHLSSLLPPVLLSAADHSIGPDTVTAASAGRVHGHDRSEVPHAWAPAEAASGANQLPARSQLTRLALPPPAAVSPSDR